MQVYTQIYKVGEVVEWNKIKDLLDNSGQDNKAKKTPYVSEVTIFDKESPRATMNAAIYVKSSQNALVG